MSCESRSVLSNSLQPHGVEPSRFFYPWDSPGKNTGVGCHALLQRIFPTQGLNSGLPHCKQILYCLSHQLCIKITLKFKKKLSARFGSTYTKIGTIQRRLAWPLRKDDRQIREAFHIFTYTPWNITQPLKRIHLNQF